MDSSQFPSPMLEIVISPPSWLTNLSHSSQSPQSKLHCSICKIDSSQFPSPMLEIVISSPSWLTNLSHSSQSPPSYPQVSELYAPPLHTPSPIFPKSWTRSLHVLSFCSTLVPSDSTTPTLTILLSIQSPLSKLHCSIREMDSSHFPSPMFEIVISSPSWLTNSSHLSQSPPSKLHYSICKMDSSQFPSPMFEIVVSSPSWLTNSSHLSQLPLSKLHCSIRKMDSSQFPSPMLEIVILLSPCCNIVFRGSYPRNAILTLSCFRNTFWNTLELYSIVLSKTIY